MVPMAKRLFDLIVASLALILLLPLGLVVAVLIKLDSPGPVFFRQQRVGRHGVPFSIHKFRTMRVEAPLQGPLLTVGADPRITRVGGFLRRTRIDELPQLIDVLRGCMSLVGPRPEVPRYVAHYPGALRDRVLAVRPGITDPASLDFIDEAALLAAAADAEREYIDHILPRKLQRAAAYAERATLATDLGVLGRTAAALLRQALGRKAA
jgi:lipopolysaccharide/colanic/teichoic acid biosynthesis glycosyltransferase